jgi:hypothetical protein
LDLEPNPRTWVLLNARGGLFLREHGGRAGKHVKGVIGHIGPEEVTILGGAGFPEASLQLQQLVVHGAIVAEIGIP